VKPTLAAPLVGNLPSDEYYKVHHPFLFEVSFSAFDIHFPEIPIANITPGPGEKGNNYEADHNS
jgi:hypothetical protein